MALNYTHARTRMLETLRNGGDVLQLAKLLGVNPETMQQWLEQLYEEVGKERFAPIDGLTDEAARYLGEADLTMELDIQVLQDAIRYETERLNTIAQLEETRLARQPDEAEDDLYRTTASQAPIAQDTQDLVRLLKLKHGILRQRTALRQESKLLPVRSDKLGRAGPDLPDDPDDIDKELAELAEKEKALQARKARTTGRRGKLHSVD